MKYGDIIKKPEVRKPDTKSPEVKKPDVRKGSSPVDSDIRSHKGEVQKSIDYIDIVNQMHEETFRFCIEKLFSFFDYCYLTKDDIRKIDFIEQLMKMQIDFSEYNKGKHIGMLNYYLDIVEKYYDCLIKCEENSRAERCKNRGYEVIENAVKSSGTLYDIEDSIVILMCLFRELGNSDAKILTDMTISITRDDIDMLDRLIEYKFQGRGAVVKKPGILEMIKSNSNQSEREEKIMYINSVLFLALGLQERGIIL